MVKNDKQSAKMDFGISAKMYEMPEYLSAYDGWGPPHLNTAKIDHFRPGARMKDVTPNRQKKAILALGAKIWPKDSPNLVPLSDAMARDGKNSGIGKGGAN